MVKMIEYSAKTLTIPLYVPDPRVRKYPIPTVSTPSNTGGSSEAEPISEALHDSSPDDFGAVEKKDDKRIAQKSNKKPNYLQSMGVEIRPLLDIYDRLRQILEKETDIDIPVLAVIGGQSMGKSSILERLSGLELPRGKGMVTRCALEIQMVSQNAGSTPCVTIRCSDDTEERVIPVGKVAEEITNITETIAPGYSINYEKAIYLRVVSSEVPDLTIVDLPGICYSNDKGGGRELLGNIKTLYEKYITRPSCIIICVLQANMDVGNQEAYTIAKEVDPSGSRTIGVVTKIDLIERSDGPTILSRLSGKGTNAFQFKLGCVAVRNRNQLEIEESMSSAEADLEEQNYFQSNANFFGSGIGSKVLGFPALVQLLVRNQADMIKAGFPSLKATLKERLKEKKNHLHSLPTTLKDQTEGIKCLLELIHKITYTVKQLYNADYKGLDYLFSPSDSDAMKKLVERVPIFFKARVLGYMMPRLQDRLEEMYRLILVKNSSPIMTESYSNRVRCALEKTRGVTLSDIMTEPAFTHLMSEEIAKMRKPSEDLIADVEQYMTALISVIVDQTISNYPLLCVEIQEIVEEIFEDSKGKCLEQLAMQLEMEDDSFTLNSDYPENVRKIFAKLDIVPNGSKTDDEAEDIMKRITNDRTIDLKVQKTYVSNKQDDRTVKELQVKLWAYRKVVHQRFCDQIGQLVRHQFPRRINEHLNSRLQERLLEIDFMRLMSEPPEQAMLRQELEDSVRRLESSLQELKRV